MNKEYKTAGTYTNTVSTSPTALEFASQITSASDVVVGVSSDGRMIFTNDNVSAAIIRVASFTPRGGGCM